MDIILRAIEFSIKKHKGQKRRETGIDYVNHPIIVSYLLAKYKTSKKMDELIAAALLHDTLEDTNTSFREIEKNFTPLVASLVAELSNDEKELKKLGKNEYLKQKLKGISSYALVIKLVDRLANIMDNPKPKYVEETLELMDYLKTVRKLSGTQKEIVKDIKIKCNEILELNKNTQIQVNN